MHNVTGSKWMFFFPLALFALCTGPCLAAAAQASSPANSSTASDTTEVKAGLGVEKLELTGAADTFEVAPDTKIYAWARVQGISPDSQVTIAFKSGDRIAYSKELTVPSTPFRIFAYKTFRKGDGGDWTAVVSGPDGKELGSTSFKVSIKE
jgi:hypothetical protein